MYFFSNRIIDQMVKYTRKPRAKRVYKKRATAKRSNAKLVSLIKRVALRQKESKNLPYSHGKIELYHNAGSPASGRILPTPIELDGVNQMPPQGFGDLQRNGDKIVQKGIKVRLLLGQKLDRKNLTFKIIVVRTTPSSVPNTIAQLFDNQTGNIMLDSINTDRVKVVYYKMIKKTMNPDNDTYGGAREFTHFHNFYLRLQRNISFTADAGKDFAGQKHYMYAFCYDAYGTLISDNCGYIQTYSNLYFKDP